MINILLNSTKVSSPCGEKLLNNRSPKNGMAKKSMVLPNIKKRTKK